MNEEELYTSYICWSGDFTSTDANDQPVLTPNRFIVGQLVDKWIHKESRSKFLAVKISFVPYLYPLHLTQI